ncbi:MAG TPA: NUDIX hydrolase [Methanoregulaceae archaeon]|nr:NUDIX hydrolase [Methanoregulaceae archaeon]
MEVYRNRRLSVETREIKYPDGRRAEGVLVHPGCAVTILPRCEDSSWLLIRQYRFAIDSFIFEAPAGTMEPGETPDETAGRELIEETGFEAGTLIGRGFIYTTPGFTDEKIYLFEARDLTPSDRFSQDEDEYIELARFSGPDLLAMCGDGRITDAKTISIVFRCLGGAS